MKRVVFASLAAALGVELVGVAWSAVRVFGLKRLDTKWGDAAGNFRIAVEFVQIEALGCLIAAGAIFFVARRVFEARSLRFAFILGVAVGETEYILRFADWFQIAAAFRLRDPLNLIFVILVPGAIAASAWILVSRDRQWGKHATSGAA